MDNDNKMTPSKGTPGSKVQLFLQHSIQAIRHDEQITYNLDEEFKKTAKNKDYFVVGIIAVIAVLVICSAWLVTSHINKSSRNVAVDIAVFEDLNLQNVLDMAKKAEDNLDSVTEKRATLQANYQQELNTLELQKNSELDILNVQRLSDAERSRRKSAVIKRYTNKEKALDNEYAPKLAALDTLLEDARKQVESFDKKRVEEAKAQKELLDNQQDLFELEKQKMKDSYETEITNLRSRMEETQKENDKLKTTQIKELMEEYEAHIASIDPVFNDEESNSFITDVSEYADVPVPFRTIPVDIPDGFQFGKNDFHEIAHGYDGLDYLLGKVAGIPYENEVDDYVRAALKMALLTGNASEQIIDSAFAQIVKEKQYQAAQQKKLAEAKDVLDQTTKERNSALQERDDALQERDVAFDERNTALQQKNDVQNDFSAFKQQFIEAATVNGYDGFILDIQNPEKPTLFIVPGALDSVLDSDEPIVYVYRPAKTLIGTLTVSRSEDGITATVENLRWNRDITPMDYISVKKR